MTVNQKFVQTPQCYLYTGLSAAATSMRIAPYPLDLDGNKLTMSDFGTSPTVTVDPKISGYEEICGFTGITDNGDNTSTLTGLTRNLTSKYPYTSSGTGKLHGASAIVVFGANPQSYGNLASKVNDDTITGKWTFPSNANRAGIDNDIDSTNATDFATVGQLSRQAISGAANASLSVKGIVQLPTQAQVDARTTTGSTSASLAVTPDKLRSTLTQDYADESGVTCTISIASPGVITSTAHGLSAGQTVVFSTTGALPTGITAGTTYYVISAGLTANAFEISTTSGGSAVNTSGTQSGTHTLYRANTYVITPSPALSAWTKGQVLSFVAKCSNTTAATLNPNGLGAKTIKKNGTLDLAANDILAGAMVEVEYDGTNLQMLSQMGNPKISTSSAETYAADSGTANTYACTLTPAPTAYTNGFTLSVKIANANTGASTLNVNGLGAIAIKKNATAALTGGELIANQIAVFEYDGTNFQLQSPAGINQSPTSTNGNFIDDLSSTTSTVIAHGLGRVPTSFYLTGYIVHGTGYSMSSGYSNGSSNNCAYIANNSNTINSSVPGSAGKAYHVASATNPANSAYKEGTVTFDATNVTIAWTKTNSPTGNVFCAWSAM